MALPIKWGGSDCFTHLLLVGPTRSGKTATIFKPIIYQLLLLKKRGIQLGLSVIEPKGDLAQMTADMAKEMELPYTHIDPMQKNTAKFNPMEGETNAVAEATVIVLKGLFGKQDAFFATVQELSARNVTKLLKELHGDNMDILDVMNTLRDPNELKKKVAQLKAKQGQTDLVHFFESELLGSMADKYRQFVIGLRAQLENIVSNDALRNIMTGASSINIDQHFETGGILAVNTALGMLRSSGDAFGQFTIMHLQNGTFRRPGTEETRIPHFLIVDEYSRYINPEVEMFLSLAAEYRVAGFFGVQSLGQLEIESGKINARAMKRSIMASCRNKMVFGGVTIDDAKDFAEEFGKDKILMRQSTYKFRFFLPMMFPDNFRDTEDEEYRFDPTDIRDGLPRFTFIHQLMQNGTMQKPAIGLGDFVPRDWKERRDWENKGKSSYFDKLKGKFIKKESEIGFSKEVLKQIELESEHEAELLETIEKEIELEQNVYASEREKMQEEYLKEVAGKVKEAADNQEKGELLGIEDDSSSESELVSMQDLEMKLVTKKSTLMSVKNRANQSASNSKNNAASDKKEQINNIERGETNVTEQTVHNQINANKSTSVGTYRNDDDFWGN